MRASRDFNNGRLWFLHWLQYILRDNQSNQKWRHTQL